MVGKVNNILVVIFGMLCWVCIAPAIFGAQEKPQRSTESSTDELFEMSLEELMNVRVTTAVKFSEKIGDIPASVVLITREDIETYGYRTLTEILENIPGLYGIDDYGDSGSNFGIRGFWSGLPNRNMIILVNGVSQINSINFSYPLSRIAVPVEAIDRIEVIRGPMSVVYGNGAFYGVINIITNNNIITDAKPNLPLSQVSVSAGTEKTTKLFLRSAGSLENFHYVFNAAVYNTDGPANELRKMTSDPSALFNIDDKTGGQLENTEKYFNFSGKFKAFYLNLSYSESRKEFYFALPSPTTGTYLNNNRLHLAFGYRKEFADKKLTLDGKITYARNQDWYKYDHNFEDFYGIQEMHTSDVGAELNASLKPSLKLEVTAGLYYQAVLDAINMYDLPSYGNPATENNYIFLSDDDNIVTQAVFAQATYTLFKKLRLVGGLRLEQSPKYKLGYLRTIGVVTDLKLNGIYDESEIEYIPRLAAIFYLNKNNVFKFLYGKAINRPSFDQNRQNSLNPLRGDLQPESIQTIELNYIGTVMPGFTLNASIFRNTLNNLITRIVEHDAQGNYQTWSGNAGEMITNGMELTMNVELFDKFRLGVSGTFQETDDKRNDFENVTVAYSPKFLGYLKAEYHTRNFTLAVTGNYVDEMETFWAETLPEVNETGPRGGRIGQRVDGYLNLSANLRINDLFMNGLYLNIKCSNLLDNEIRYPTFTSNQWLDRGTIGITRTFLLSLGYKF